MNTYWQCEKSDDEWEQGPVESCNCISNIFECLMNDEETLPGRNTTVMNNHLKNKNFGNNINKTIRNNDIITDNCEDYKSEIGEI